MKTREVVKDLEYWARLAGAYKERRRIRRAIAPALKALRSLMRNGGDWYKFRDSLRTIDRATKAPKRKAAKGTR